MLSCALLRYRINMWGNQQSSSKKVSSSDQCRKTQDGRNTAEPSTNLKNEGKDMTDCSLYDSGRTDSGFLSGANLLSDTIVTDEIRSPSPKPEKSEVEKLESKSYSRLDSGVDVGLSDQLSELCIDEPGNDTDDKVNPLLSRVNIQPEPASSRQAAQRPPVQESSRIPWEYYFQQDEEGDTQLHIAIIQGFIEVVFHLIRLVPKASYLDIRNDMRQTPLHLAVLTGQARIVRRLVCAGADTRTVDHDGNTPLHIAVAAGDFPCVKALTEPVYPTEVLAAELRYSAPTIPSPLPDMYNYEGLTCVHIAIMGGHIGILKYLVKDVQANINARECKRGMSCLHMACEAGNESLAMILLEMHANHSLHNYAGDTPYGVARNHTGILRLLLASGASPEVFSDSEEEDDDDFQMYGFRDLHLNGIVNATA